MMIIRKQSNNEMELCLCGRCLSDFYLSNAYKIKRSRPNQPEKDICTFCNTRRGYDYIVEKNEMYELNNRTFEEQSQNE